MDCGMNGERVTLGGPSVGRKKVFKGVFKGVFKVF
jgi:hypothetical protein